MEVVKVARMIVNTVISLTSNPVWSATVDTFCRKLPVYHANLPVSNAYLHHFAWHARMVITISRLKIKILGSAYNVHILV